VLSQRIQNYSWVQYIYLSMMDSRPKCLDEH